MASLDAYTGEFSQREASHLLRRASFGGSQADVATAVSDGLETTMTKLFTERVELTEPINHENGLPWVDKGPGWDQTKAAPFYNAILRTWWMQRMIENPVNIHEKLTLFWHNHFASEWTIISNGSMSYHMINHLRTNCLGNFKAMARQVSIEPSMLRYLNGNSNTVGNPNENYARELQELFTIGKGPVAGDGDYTYYTEQDVREAARVLTGWRDNRIDWKTIFVERWHDTGDKQFSERYQNTIIKGRTGPDAGFEELDELIEMIFRQNRTSEYIVEKLFTWFVDNKITDEIRRDVIEPLASQLRDENWVIEGVLKRLLSSEIFFDLEAIGAQLGSPADFIVGLLRKSTTWAPPVDSPSNTHRFYLQLVNYMAALQMALGDPPSVAGWEAYYQNPGFDQVWITTATLPLRNGLTDAALFSNRANGGLALIDSLEFIENLSDPSDAFALIDELNEIFFTYPFTEELRLKLAEDVLMNGGKYYEWTIVWGAYKADPSPTNTLLIKTFTDRLFRYMFRMAEYQLV